MATVIQQAHGDGPGRASRSPGVSPIHPPLTLRGGTPMPVSPGQLKKAKPRRMAAHSARKHAGPPLSGLLRQAFPCPPHLDLTQDWPSKKAAQLHGFRALAATSEALTLKEQDAFFPAKRLLLSFPQSREREPVRPLPAGRPRGTIPPPPIPRFPPGSETQHCPLQKHQSRLRPAARAPELARTPELPAPHPATTVPSFPGLRRWVPSCETTRVRRGKICPVPLPLLPDPKTKWTQAAARPARVMGPAPPRWPKSSICPIPSGSCQAWTANAQNHFRQGLGQCQRA